jgi:uncharacterized membrane protein
MDQINVPEVVICVIASQIANVGESIIGAAFQDKEGFQWVSKQKTDNLISHIALTIFPFFFSYEGDWGV